MRLLSGRGTVLRTAAACFLLACATPAAAAGSAAQAEGADGEQCAPGLVLGGVGLAAGGQLRLTGNQANFGFHDRTVDSDQPGSDFLNQRFRGWVNVHDRESCRYGAYVQMEAGGALRGVRPLAA